MKQEVWKYLVPVKHTALIDMPTGAKILKVGLQNQCPVIWALVNPENPKVPRRINVVGTGHDAGDVHPLDYVGSVQMESGIGELVWHFFDGGEE
jgi:hypothetical protein